MEVSEAFCAQFSAIVDDIKLNAAKSLFQEIDAKALDLIALFVREGKSIIKCSDQCTQVRPEDFDNNVNTISSSPKIDYDQNVPQEPIVQSNDSEQFQVNCPNCDSSSNCCCFKCKANESDLEEENSDNEDGEYIGEHDTTKDQMETYRKRHSDEMAINDICDLSNKKAKFGFFGINETKLIKSDTSKQACGELLTPMRLFPREEFDSDEYDMDLISGDGFAQSNEASEASIDESLSDDSQNEESPTTDANVPGTSACSTMEAFNEFQMPPIIIKHLCCFLKWCSATFNNKQQKDEHMLTMHNTLLHRCLVPKCHKSFDTDLLLIGHYQQHHGIIDKWPCTTCNRIFEKHTQLQIHDSTVHEEGLFGCVSCQYTGNYRYLVRIHHQHYHQEFICFQNSCYKSFKNQAALERHKSTHIGQNSVKPQMQAKKMKEATENTKLYSKQSEKSNYRCKWIGCTFTSESIKSTKRHIRTVHFKLPKTIKEQKERNIEHDVDYKQFIELA